MLEDCKATCDVLVYKETENGYFYLQWYFGINKLVRQYFGRRAPSLPTLTSEELDKQDSTCVEIVNFYQQPKRLQAPSLQVASLQQLSKTYIGTSISSKTIEFDPNFEGQEHSFFQLSWGLQPNASSRKINEPFASISITPEQIYKASDFFKKQVLSIPDTRPVPILADLATGQLEEVSDKVIAEYVRPRYEDWVEAGGQYAERLGLLKPFWIDLWSEEALTIFQDPSLDNHPRLKIKQEWRLQYQREQAKETK